MAVLRSSAVSTCTVKCSAAVALLLLLLWLRLRRQQRLVWPCKAGSAKRAKGRRKGIKALKEVQKVRTQTYFWALTCVFLSVYVLSVYVLSVCVLSACVGQSKQLLTSASDRFSLLKHLLYFRYYSCKLVIGALYYPKYLNMSKSDASARQGHYKANTLNTQVSWRARAHPLVLSPSLPTNSLFLSLSLFPNLTLWFTLNRTLGCVVMRLRLSYANPKRRIRCSSVATSTMKI